MCSKQINEWQVEVFWDLSLEPCPCIKRNETPVPIIFYSRQIAKMSLFQEVMVLLWCAVCVKAACSNETVCVAIQNRSETECQHYYPIVYKLSDLTANETGCKTVRIYLTSGTHILDRDLFIINSVQETEIHGAPHGPPSIIDCRNEFEINFSENRSD